MKNIIFSFFVLSLAFNQAFAQTHDFLTTREEAFRGYSIKQGNDYLRRKEVAQMMEVNPLASEIFKISSTHRTIGLTTGWIGSGLFFYSLIRFEQGQNTMPLLLVSSILVIPSPYFILSSRNKDREAIDLYNFDQCCKTGSNRTNAELKASVFPPRLSLTFK
ncbi:MAG TPA: hypothetical protein PKC24_08935 [Cyclobacteriaceae bacterium]|nr:hypothetical protein [Cyclobacteriaceae bacterium]